jgi:DNA-binding NtrC family response regulator
MRMLLRGDRIRSRAVANKGPVLVVEDDASLRLLARVNLELERFRVREAGTLEEARAALAVERPAVVFLDVHLHGIDSGSLLQEVTAAGIPVVVVTGTADIEAYRDRANAVLAKPFEPADLVAAARRFVG